MKKLRDSGITIIALVMTIIILLILAQNKKLAKYVNKLKLHLSKSYTAIETVNKLQKQNTDLQYENQELKRENHKLKNYINKTFEVVKHLFNFPLDTFKRLVDNFVKSFDKDNL